MKPLISVIVPVYKTEKYLDKCVESIVKQTHQNLEIILVDDGSPDNCPSMCDAWAQKDSRIKVLHIENNGVANARNQALKITSGEYIGFVDSDDYIEPNMFQILLENLIHSNSDISVCGFQINDETDVYSNIRSVTRQEALKRICVGDYKYGVLWNKLYCKKIIGDTEMPHLACCEDLVFNYYVFKNANTIVECESKLYHYFQNEDGTVNGKFGYGAFDAVKSKKIMLEYENDTDLREYAVRGLISSCFVVLSGCIQNDVFPKEKKKLINTIKLHKEEILKSNLYSITDKLKTVLLLISPKIYETLLKRSHKK